MPRFINRRNPANRTLDTVRRVRNASPELIDLARAHRKAPTPAEAILWAALRNRKLDGLRFRRQHPVGTTILDFYCPEFRLAVEVDGAYHDAPEQKARDAERTHFQELKGYRIVRFRNEEILNDLGVVLETIRAATRASP